MKFCTKCKIEKSIDEFYKIKGYLDRKSSWCKSCRVILSKKYYQEHKFKTKAYKKRYYQENKEQIKKYHDGRKELKKKWREENKEQIKVQVKKYYLKHREERKEEKKIYDKNYYKNKRKTDINYRIKDNLKTRIVKILKGKNKSLSTMMLIGCEVDYLMFHLQSQFKLGMSWDNYGRGLGNKGLKEWHIDHIKPCASFDLSKPEEQLKCFNYTNLQPLWAKENLTKSAKWNKIGNKL